MHPLEVYSTIRDICNVKTLFNCMETFVEFLGQQLDDYVAKLPVTTRVLRLPNREGIIAARLLGANNATGKVLTFLDAHCECTVGYLEPLLARVKENRKNVVCPVIDIISDENFGYLKSFELHWGAFNWQLHFRYKACAINDKILFNILPLFFHQMVPIECL